MMDSEHLQELQACLPPLCLHVQVVEEKTENNTGVNQCSTDDGHTVLFHFFSEFFLAFIFSLKSDKDTFLCSVNILFILNVFSYA